MFERTCRFIESPIQIEYVCQPKTKLDKSKNPKDKDNGSKMEKNSNLYIKFSVIPLRAVITLHVTNFI
jgi:hypothetical protein